MEIEILLSTMNEKTINRQYLDKRNIKSKVIVINQNHCEKASATANNVRLYSYQEVGLSKSRNRAIDKSVGDVCVITDDDVVFSNNYEACIKKAYESIPEADLITFNVLKEGEIPFKIISKKVLRHNHLTIMKAISVGITFKSNIIRENNIRFDERFGLGSIYPGGEENIFLSDCLKKGLKLYHYPDFLCKHDHDSSGSNLDKIAITSKGAMFRRMFGFLGIFFTILFMIKKRNKIPFSIIKSVKYGINGFIHYKSMTQPDQ